MTSQSWSIQGDSFHEAYTYNDPDNNNPSAPQDGSLKRMTTAAGATNACAYRNLGTTNGIPQTTVNVYVH